MKTRYSLVFILLFFIFGVHSLLGVDRNIQVRQYGFSIRCMTLNEQSENTVTDIDSHVYQIKKIGDQWWMTENLKVSRYRNGDVILTDLNDQQWHDADYGAFTVYPHEYVAGLYSSNEVIAAYGKLYNWYAVDDPRGVCPAGWHVPSDEEFKQLEMHLGMTRIAADSLTWRGTDQGKQMKSVRMAPDPHPRWAWPNTGATNTSGFSGLPGGARHPDGWYYGLEYFGYWWTASFFSEHSRDFIYYRRLDCRLEPEPPSLVFPRGAVTGMGLATRFKWTPDSQADVHHNQLHVTDNKGFVLDVGNLKENEYVVYNLKNDTEYSWKVRSKNFYGIGEWSEPRTFMTVEPPRTRETKQVSVGNDQVIEFEESGLKIMANVQKSGDMTVEVYDHPPFAAPYPGGFPKGFSKTDQSYIYISDDDARFSDGVLHIPPEMLPERVTPDNIDPEKMTILTRPVSGDPWVNIGGEFDDSMYRNKVVIMRLGEFAIGLSQDGPFKKFNVTISGIDNGIINPRGNVDVEYGQDLVITITPDEGYRVAFIRLNGVDIDLENDPHWNAASGTFTLASVVVDQHLEVGFELITFIVTATAGDNGHVNPEGEVSVDYGNDLVVTITPDESYRVAFIRLNGVDIDLQNDPQWDAASGTFTLASVVVDQHLEIGFELITFTLEFLVTDAATGAEIPDATIKLEDSWNDAGMYVFEQVMPGSYDYLVSKAGYFDKGGMAAISDDHLTEVVELEIDDTGLPAPTMSRLKVYPNPATHVIWVDLGSHKREKLTLRIYNMQGQVTWQQSWEPQGEETLHINIGNLKPGVYLVSLVCHDGIFMERLFIRSSGSSL